MCMHTVECFSLVTHILMARLSVLEICVITLNDSNFRILRRDKCEVSCVSSHEGQKRDKLECGFILAVLRQLF
jgi:hypothetical protein